MTSGFFRAFLLFAVILPSAFGQGNGDSFQLNRVSIEGNTLIPAATLDAATRPYLGEKRTFRDIQHTLEALENTYRKAGYGAVQVILPEQELSNGVLLIQIKETPLGNITVTGNQHFSAANIRASLTALQEGASPNTRLLSENLQLANENPAKEVKVVLGVGEKPGTIDAKVTVTDESPLRFYITADNTGTSTTGRHRLGVSVQHANLFDRDHTATLSYITSPDKPDGTQVSIYSLGYRVPLYGFGDSIDVFYASSNTSTPSSALTLGAFQSLSGRGNIAGIRWNHHFARRGEYTSKFIAGLDYKDIEAICKDANGVRVPFGTTAGCTPYTVRPLSLTYVGNLASPSLGAELQASFLHNLPTGKRYDYNVTGGRTGSDRYSLVASNRKMQDHFSLLRIGGSISKPLFKDWIARIALNAQSSFGKPLVGAEQIGLAGAMAVRGFHERAIASDAGIVMNLELYGPNLANILGLPGTLQPLVFYDRGRGWSYDSPDGQTVSTLVQDIESVGAGLRYQHQKDVSFRFDVANALLAGPASSSAGPMYTAHKDWRGHFSLAIGF